MPFFDFKREYQKNETSGVRVASPLDTAPQGQACKHQTYANNETLIVFLKKTFSPTVDAKSDIVLYVRRFN